MLMSTDLQKYIEKVIIDEERNHVLTNISNSNEETNVKKSDHNLNITKMKIK